MRYIGNKTRLLGFIRGVLRRRGITPGTAIDPFTGTASVARALKSWGFRVTASDVMEYAYVFGRAYVEVAAPPALGRLEPELGRAAGSLGGVVAWLNRLRPRPGTVHRHYSPEGDEGRRHGRMYFTPENAARIDAVRERLERWRDQGAIDEDGFHVLLAALIEAADRVANTTGVYASFVKSWQPNAARPLQLRTPRIIASNGCRALRADALDAVAEAGPVDLLYIDPPYNTRQYPGYYHVPELIALGWAEGEPETRGKTGLLPDAHKRSAWSRRRTCVGALEALLAASRARHIVMSYNTEGIIPEPEIERLLRAHGRATTYRRYTRGYRRYRSDADRAGRRYSGDEVGERLYCVDTE